MVSMNCDQGKLEEKLREKKKGKVETYHEITAMPMKALMMLNTKATIPLAVNPAGIGPGDRFWPDRSLRSSVLPAAFPATAIPWEVHAARWSSGILMDDCRASGASIKVATRPLATCHSMWQWKSQTRRMGQSGMVRRMGTHLSGLSARKRRTI